MHTILELIFWSAVAALLYGQFVYPLLVAVVSLPFGGSGRGDNRTGACAARPGLDDDALPTVSLVIAAYAEAEVIAEKVANSIALDYPRQKLQVVVACDGSPDETAARARSAGADLVLELPRSGKMGAQNQAVAQADGELLAFSDANAFWQPDALRRLVTVFDDIRVGYVCGQVTFVNTGGTNQEGLYWRYEMWLRERESRLRSVTAGNGAIYAVRPSTYKTIAPTMGHDLSLPFNTVKLGGVALYEPRARATETMVPSVEGEFKRKRRMMTFAWPIVLRGGMLSPRGYGLVYGWMIFSHRALRYATPLLHALALGTSAALAFDSTLYLMLFATQIALIAAALLAAVLPARVLLIARYYVLTTASLALGLWDYLRRGAPAGWSPPEGTR